jgi:hypothetical protein
MTGKSAFTQDEWRAVVEAPPIAGMLVLTAQSGGSIRESFALAKSYAEAREQHGESELLDELVSEKPEFDNERFDTAEKLEHDGPARLHEALAVLQSKATPAEVDDFRDFVLTLAKRVAAAHKEGGESVGPPEQAAIDRIGESLGVQGP